MSSSPRTRQTVAVRREEILLAAIAEVERVGLAAVRVSDVAAALGISTGLVFYHFRTKDELVAEAFTYAVERDLAAMERAASRRGDVLDRIRAVLRSYGPTGSATGWRLWIDGWALAQHEPVIAGHFRAWRRSAGTGALAGRRGPGRRHPDVPRPGRQRARGCWPCSTVSRWPPRSSGRSSRASCGAGWTRAIASELGGARPSSGRQGCGIHHGTGSTP